MWRFPYLMEVLVSTLEETMARLELELAELRAKPDNTRYQLLRQDELGAVIAALRMFRPKSL